MLSQTVSSKRTQINDYIDQMQNKLNNMHNKTIDKVTAKQDQYMPDVRKYDH